jgi:hypothetical protein
MRAGLGTELPAQVLVARKAKALGVGINGGDHVVWQIADENVRHPAHLLRNR